MRSWAPAGGCLGWPDRPEAQDRGLLEIVRPQPMREAGHGREIFLEGWVSWAFLGHEGEKMHLQPLKKWCTLSITSGHSVFKILPSPPLCAVPTSAPGAMLDAWCGRWLPEASVHWRMAKLGSRLKTEHPTHPGSLGTQSISLFCLVQLDNSKTWRVEEGYKVPSYPMTSCHGKKGRSCLMPHDIT